MMDCLIGGVVRQGLLVEMLIGLLSENRGRLKRGSISSAVGL
jgi:hypothetical protein